MNRRGTSSDRKSGTVRLVPGSASAPAEFGAGHPSQLSRGRVRTLVVTSGRDGVGKSNLAVNLAVALGQRGARVVLVDGDLAKANLDLLLGVHPRWDLGHVLAGEKTLDEVVVQGPDQVTLVPGAAGAPELAELDDIRRELLLRSLGIADEGADLMIVDTASGMSRQTLELCRMAHDLLVVATPEMATFSDAYGLVKKLQQEGALARAPRLIVNMATTLEEAEEATNRMQLFARHFLRLEVEALGTVPFDPSVARAVRAQEPVMIAYPLSAAAAAYRALAARLWKPVPSGPDSELSAEKSHRLEA
jgi:flagellar biosynthesis protein FlhG